MIAKPQAELCEPTGFDALGNGKQALFYATVALLVIALVALSMAAYADAQTRINCPAGPEGYSTAPPCRPGR